MTIQTYNIMGKFIVQSVFVRENRASGSPKLTLLASIILSIIKDLNHMLKLSIVKINS